jgi:hypothetical protein
LEAEAKVNRIILTDLDTSPTPNKGLGLRRSKRSSEDKGMDEENWIMLTNLDSISDPEQRTWLEKWQKVIRGKWHR